MSTCDKESYLWRAVKQSFQELQDLIENQSKTVVKAELASIRGAIETVLLQQPPSATSQSTSETKSATRPRPSKFLTAAHYGHPYKEEETEYIQKEYANMIRANENRKETIARLSEELGRPPDSIRKKFLEFDKKQQTASEHLLVEAFNSKCQTNPFSGKQVSFRSKSLPHASQVKHSACLYSDADNAVLADAYAQWWQRGQKPFRSIVRDVAKQLNRSPSAIKAKLNAIAAAQGHPMPWQYRWMVDICANTDDFTEQHASEAMVEQLVLRLRAPKEEVRRWVQDLIQRFQPTASLATLSVTGLGSGGCVGDSHRADKNTLVDDFEEQEYWSERINTNELPQSAAAVTGVTGQRSSPPMQLVPDHLLTVPSGFLGPEEEGETWRYESGR